MKIIMDKYIGLSDLLPPDDLDIFNCGKNCTTMVRYLHEISKKVEEFEREYRNLAKLDTNIRNKKQRKAQR